MTMASCCRTASSAARALILRGKVMVLTRNPNKKMPAAASGARYTERKSHNSRRIDQYKICVAGMPLGTLPGEATCAPCIAFDSVFIQWLPALAIHELLFMPPKNQSFGFQFSFVFLCVRSLH